MKRLRGPKHFDWYHALALNSARRREVARHVRSIVGRTRELHPRDPAKQRRALQRWAGVLAANDPEVSVALLEAPLRRTG